MLLIKKTDILSRSRLICRRNIKTLSKILDAQVSFRTIVQHPQSNSSSAHHMSRYKKNYLYKRR